MSMPKQHLTPDTRRHREMLVIAGVVILASFVLEVGTEERVGLFGASQLRLPPLCSSREWFGVKCPACGLTRSFVHLAHGDWPASTQAHPVGWLLALVLLLQIPYRIHELRQPQRPWLTLRTRQWVGHALIALLVVHWVVDMAVGYLV
jgi:hypothetical protein